MSDNRLQFTSLYLMSFASSFGYITVLTLLPTYIDLLDPSGIVVGLFVTALTFAKAVGVIPLGWAGDHYDKRTVLLGSLAISVGAYVLFPRIDSSTGFIVARTLQGVGLVGVGLLGLAVLGDLAPVSERANYIGKYNAWRMAAGVVGTLSAGALYEYYGFGVVFGLLTALLSVALLGVWGFTDPDETRVTGFAFTDLSLNRRILTLTSFRAQYAIAVTLTRTWVPIYVGVSVARGGLALSAIAVGIVLAAEKLTNMLCQPYTGALSDRYGRALFVFAGGGLYGIVALSIPFASTIGTMLGVPATFPVLGSLSVAFLPVIVLNGLLGVADSFREPASMALFADEGTGTGIASSFGIRSLVWQPGSVIAPLIGGVLMARVGIEWVFVLGGLTALTGVATFFGVLSYTYGRRALVEW